MTEPRQPFAEGPGVDKIRASTLRMWMVSALGKGGGQAVQMLALVVLARVLVPEDFGVVAMAMVLIGVADVFRDFGLSAATVRSPDLTREQASAMFVVNALLGAVMTALVVVAAPLVLLFYSEPKVVLVVQCLAWTFLFNGLSAQHQALLRRQLKFGVLAWVNLAVALLGQGVAVILALEGYGYWALVAAAVLSSIVRMLAVFAVHPWLPKNPQFDAAARSMLSFGGYLALFGFIGFLANHSHSLIIGERYGAAEVAYYNRAFVLLTLALSYVMAPLSTVVPATLSRVLNDAAEYKSLYLHYLGMMLGMTAPIGFLLALTGPDVIALVLGGQWASSAVILQLLALSVIPRTIASSSGWLYQSHGDSRRMMQWGLGGWLFLLLLLVLGAQYGIVGVAVAYSVGMCLLVAPCMWFAFRKTRLRLADLLPVSLPIAGASILALAPAAPLWLWLSDSAVVFRFLLVAAIYGSMYLFLLVTVFGQRDTVMGMLQQLIPGRLRSAAVQQTVGING